MSFPSYIQSYMCESNGDVISPDYSGYGTDCPDVDPIQWSDLLHEVFGSMMDNILNPLDVAKEIA